MASKFLQNENDLRFIIRWKIPWKIWSAVPKNDQHGAKNVPYRAALLARANGVSMNPFAADITLIANKTVTIFETMFELRF